MTRMFESAKPAGVIHLPLNRISNRLLRNLLLPAGPAIEWLLGIPRLNAIHRRAAGMDPALPFADRTLQAMGVSYTVADEDRAQIPTQGPVVVVANHPFGGIEGIILLSLLLRLFPPFHTPAASGAVPLVSE